MHDNGIAHWDIKLENILLDDKFNIKICDFGFATDEKVRKVKKGTESYLAPEIFVEKEYETFLTDIFAVGVVLFEMLKGSLPFGIASSRDQYYSLFKLKNNFFWKTHSTREAKDFFSEEFKNLINGMLNIKPLERFTLEEIKQSDWYNGPLPTDDEIVSEFNRRKEIIECLETQ